MDNTKLDLSGETKATYKAIPEADMEEEAVKKAKSNLVKAKAAGAEGDGADEVMLPKDEKIQEAGGDVKYSVNEKQNGDAKLDIGELKEAFVGLTKEELMKYANDPFWVRLRWFLFILFWTLWVAMLFGAIMIIYAAPKCDPPPPKTWWQQGPLTEVKESITVDDLKSLKEKGVKGAIINWPDDIYAADFNDSNTIIDLLKKIKEEHINIIIELDPSTSNNWFSQSSSKDSEYFDYYIWKEPKGFNESSVPIAPNNWLNTNNKSSWLYSEDRKQFYYAPFGRPHLNFRNNNVTEEFSNIIRKLLDLGAGGIRLRNVPYLLVDSKFEDEGVSNNHDYNLGEYGFYTHTRTENVPELGELLGKWKTIIKTSTDNGPLMAADQLHRIESYKVNNTLVIDLPLESKLFTKNNLNALDIKKGIHSIFTVDNIQWPLWKYTTSSALDIVTFLLPGTPLIREDATLNTDLLKIRESQSIMRGNFSYYAVANNTVFAFVRVASGNPGILVAYNPTDERVVVDFPKEIPVVSEEVTVQLFSSNYQEEGVPLNLKQDAHKIPISANASIVLSYVPKN